MICFDYLKVRSYSSDLFSNVDKAQKQLLKRADSYRSGAPSHDRGVMFHGRTGASSENAVLGARFVLQVTGFHYTIFNTSSLQISSGVLPFV